MLHAFVDVEAWGDGLTGAARFHARRAPDAVAVRDASGASTFGELWAARARLAVGMAMRGVASGGTVGMVLPAGRLAAEGLVASAILGARPLLFPAHLTSDTARALASEWCCDLCVFEETAYQMAACVPLTARPYAPPSATTEYLLVDHGGPVVRPCADAATAAAAARRQHLAAGRRHLVAAPWSTQAGYAQAELTLIVGGSLLVPADGRSVALLATIERERAETAAMPLSTANALMDLVELRDADAELASLHTLVVIGDEPFDGLRRRLRPSIDTVRA